MNELKRIAQQSAIPKKLKKSQRINGIRDVNSCKASNAGIASLT